MKEFFYGCVLFALAFIYTWKMLIAATN